MLPPLHGQFRGVSPFPRNIHYCSRPRQVCASFGRRSAKADDFLWTRPLEAFEVQLLNELREREFPRLLLVVVELPEFLGVHSQFARSERARRSSDGVSWLRAKESAFEELFACPHEASCDSRCHSPTTGDGRVFPAINAGSAFFIPSRVALGQGFCTVISGFCTRFRRP